MDKYLDTLIKYKDDPNSKVFKEALYEYYKSKNYSEMALIDLYNTINIKPNALKKYLYSYIKIYIKMDKKTFETYIEKAKRTNNELYLKKENLLLKELGINTEYLWTNDKEKEYILKKVYEYYKSGLSFSEISKKSNINESKILDIIGEYKEMLKNNKELNRLPISQNGNSSILKNCYKIVINSEDPQKIKDVIDNCGYTYYDVKANFYLYSDNYTNEEVELFYEHWDMFLKYRKELTKKSSLERKKEKEEEKIQVSIKYITSFITSDKSLDEFLINNKLNKSNFDAYVKLLENSDKDLYAKAQEKLSNETEILNKQILEIGEKLETGYLENDKIRKFDAIDYLSITNLPLSVFSTRALKVLTKKQIVLLKKFRECNIKIEENNNSEIAEILKEERIIGFELDKFGKVIEGSGRKITDEEKNNLLDYLKANNIPINRKTYGAALKRYINNFLTFEKNKQLILK